MTSDRRGSSSPAGRSPAAAVQTAVGQAGSTAAGKLAAKRRAVFRLEGVHERCDAGTGDGFELLIRLHGTRVGLRGKPLERPGPGPLPTVVVDEGVPKHAVEPPCGRLCALQRVGPAESADERLLQNILRLVARPDPALQE